MFSIYDIKWEQFFAPYLKDNQFVHLLLEVVMQTAVHMAFFHRKDILILDRI